jgi:hypothetical protein
MGAKDNMTDLLETGADWPGLVEETPRQKAEKDGQYIPAMPIRLAEKMAGINPSYRWVFVICWYLCRSRIKEADRQNGWVGFPNKVAARFGIKRHAKARALRALSRAKLIQLKSPGRRSSMVKIKH